METLGTLWIWEVPFAIRRIYLKGNQLHLQARHDFDREVTLAWPDLVPIRICSPDGTEVTRGMCRTAELDLPRYTVYLGDSIEITHRMTVDYHLPKDRE